jgi:hypothetical protein
LSPFFASAVLNQAENGDSQFWKEKFRAIIMTVIFSFWVPGWRGIFSFFPLFPICSHQVFELFPEMFPMAPRFYAYWFAHNSTPMSINWNLEGHVCFYFATRVQRPASITGMPNVPQKNCWWADRYGSLKIFIFLNTPMNLLIWIANY